jgi:hypothetical protein
VWTQVVPHEIVESLLATEPEPPPARLTVSWFSSKFAVADCELVRKTLQVPVVLLQAPLHPVKCESAVRAVAVRVTEVLAS